MNSAPIRPRQPWSNASFFGALGLLMKVAASAVPGTVQPQATAYLCAAAVAGATPLHLLVALKDEVENNVDLTLCSFGTSNT